MSAAETRKRTTTWRSKWVKIGDFIECDSEPGRQKIRARIKSVEEAKYIDRLIGLGRWQKINSDTVGFVEEESSQ